MLVLCSFYKIEDTTWDELQVIASKKLDEMEEMELKSGDNRKWIENWYSDHRMAVNMGLKTFILNVLNDFNEKGENIIYENNTFYKSYQDGEIGEIDINGDFTKIDQGNLIFSSKEETLSFLTKNKQHINVSEQAFETMFAFWEKHPNGLMELGFIDFD